jgi:hypothetical protein
VIPLCFIAPKNRWATLFSCAQKKKEGTSHGIRKCLRL